jgi:transposase
MIAVTPRMRILLATEPTDFRKGIDSLAGVCRNVLDTDPFTGYVFVNKKKDIHKDTYL